MAKRSWYLGEAMEPTTSLEVAPVRMNEFDFDCVIDRCGTASHKWARYEGRDVIPLWVADMDFRSAPPIIEALLERTSHGVFGYTDPPAGLVDAVRTSLLTEYRWDVNPEWIVWLPGLVSGLNVLCRAAGAAGDDVITLTPIYPPFLSAPVFAESDPGQGTAEPCGGLLAARSRGLGTSHWTAGQASAALLAPQPGGPGLV